MEDFNIELVKAGRQVITKDNYPVDILAYEGDNKFPIIGVVHGKNNRTLVAYDMKGIPLIPRDFSLTLKIRSICDNDCNSCAIISSKNSRVITNILNKLHNKFGNEVYNIIQSICPNLTTCCNCRIDNFSHNDTCTIKI